MENALIDSLKSVYLLSLKTVQMSLSDPTKISRGLEKLSMALSILIYVC